jgi:hypothetical protein
MFKTDYIPTLYWGMKTAWIIHPLATTETLISNYLAMPLVQILVMKTKDDLYVTHTHTVLHITGKLTYVHILGQVSDKASVRWTE